MHILKLILPPLSLFSLERLVYLTITNVDPKMLCFALSPKEMSNNNSTNTSLILPVGMRS